MGRWVYEVGHRSLDGWCVGAWLRGGCMDGEKDGWMDEWKG